MFATFLYILAGFVVFIAVLASIGKWADATGWTEMLQHNNTQLDLRSSVVKDFDEIADAVEVFLTESSLCNEVDFHKVSCLTAFEKFNDPEFLDLLEDPDSGQKEFAEVFVKHHDFKTTADILTHLKEWAELVDYRIKDLRSSEFLEEIQWVLHFSKEFHEKNVVTNGFKEEIPTMDEVMPEYAPFSESLHRAKLCKETAEVKIIVMRYLRTGNRDDAMKNISEIVKSGL